MEDIAFALKILTLSPDQLRDLPDQQLIDRLKTTKEELSTLGKMPNVFSPALEQKLKEKALTVLVDYIASLEQRIISLEENKG